MQTGALSHGIAAHRASGGGALAGSGQSDHAGDAVQLSQHPEEVEGGPSVNMQDLLKHVIGAPIVPKNRELPPPGPPPKRDWYPGQ